MKKFAIFKGYIVANLLLLLRRPFHFNLPNFMRFQLWGTWFLLVPFCLERWFYTHVSLRRPWWSILHQFKRTYSSGLSPQKTSKHTKQVSSFVRISSILIQAHAFSMNHSFVGGWLSICNSYTLKVWLIVILVL